MQEKRSDLSDIMKHSLEILQFSNVCKIISSYCITDEGKIKCLNRVPFSNIEEVETEKKLGKDFLNLINNHNMPPLHYRPPVLQFLNGIEKDGAALDIEGVYSIGLLAKSVCMLKDWVSSLLQKEIFLENAVVKFIDKKMPEMLDLKKIIFSFIDENGVLQDLPTLRAIKNKIKNIESEIEKIMHSYLTNERIRAMLQSYVPTVKDGRQVISVMSNFKGRIKGIIHEYSQSGQTFYLEPEEVVLKNNDLLVANAEYERELWRLLQRLTAEIAKKIKLIKINCNLLIQLDCIAAGAKWANSKKCVYAKQFDNSSEKEISDVKNKTEGFLLHRARHPLLGDSAVPIDLKLPKEDRVLIITGPNTGGKTVTLKTVGLFALINQSGWPVPAGEKTKLPFFDFIACDIGDEQSLYQSLSTFSSHMKTIAKIINNATQNSLIILDELGSGTDPQEGCAISMAVLDILIEKKSFVFVTTHHGSLKNYGYSKPSCINASVEFNDNTLVPTYKIVMGVPGESHAIDIALKNGLDKNIIEKAKNYLDNNQADVSDLIKGLIKKHSELNEFEEQKIEKEIALKEKIRNTDLKNLELKQKELELKQTGIKKLDLFFKEKRRSLENLVRVLREGELTKQKTIGVKTWIEEFNLELQNERENLKTEQYELNAQLQNIKIKKNLNETKSKNNVIAFYIGMKVFAKNYNRIGKILRKEKKNKWLVALDSLKIIIDEKDLEEYKNQDETQFAKPVIISCSASLKEKPALELRLLGMRAEEAENILQNQIDSALVHNLQEFSVIHGKGTGILQRLTHELLKKSSFVKDYYFAKPENGGTGKTIVVLG